MSKFRSVLLAAAVLATISETSAHAAPAAVNATHVVLIEPSYMPDSIAFWIDKPVGACPANSWLRWYARGVDAAGKVANVNAIYSLLVTALASGKSVNVGVEDSNCSVAVLQINNN
jgi:hypothetical protein